MSEQKDVRPLVMYVDDEVPNRLVFQATFGHEFRVKVAESVEEALKLLKDELVAVVLADQRMPNATGVDLLTRVKESHPDAIRVLVTAYTDQEPIVQAVNRVQIDRFIPKPWDNREMEALIAGAIDTFHTRRKVKDLEYSLITSQRAEVLGQLAAGLVHDMANPLAAITANIERLRYGEPFFKAIAEHGFSGNDEERELVSELPELARDLESSTNFLTELVKGIRQHWRPTQQDTEADLKAVVEFCKKMISRRALDARAKMFYECPEVPRVKISPVLMCQVILNLLSNSIQAFTADSPKREVHLAVRAYGKGVEIVVRDTGTGIAPDVLARLLSGEQVTTKPAGEGTGLGVMTTRVSIERAKGEFAMDSTVGTGTFTRVWLPAV